MEYEEDRWDISPIVHQTAQSLCAKHSQLADQYQSTRRKLYRDELPRQREEQNYKTYDKTLPISNTRSVHQSCRKYIQLQKQVIQLKKKNIMLEEQLFRNGLALHELQTKLQAGGQAGLKQLQRQMQLFQRKIATEQVYKVVQNLTIQLQKVQLQNESLRNKKEERPIASKRKTGELEELRQEIEVMKEKLKQEKDSNRKLKAEVVGLKQDKLGLLKRLMQIGDEGRRSQLQESQCESVEVSAQSNHIKHIVQDINELRKIHRQLFEQLK